MSDHDEHLRASYVVEGATYDRLEAKCDGYREALEKIAAKVPSDGQGGDMVVRVSAARACEIATAALSEPSTARAAGIAPRRQSS